MKNKKLISLTWMTAGALLMLLAFSDRIFNKKIPGETRTAQPANREMDLEKIIYNTSDERESITFILGEDNKPGDTFFTEATLYYRHHPEEGTERVVTTCKSLLEVRDYLAEYPPDNGSPWGKVNLVAHGNEWSGLGVPVLPEGKRTTVTTLHYAVETNTFKPLPAHLADACTEFHIHGCAVGRNAKLLEAIRNAFAGRRELEVSSSPYFIKYDSGKENGLMGNSRRQLLEGFYAFYPKNYRPADGKLAAQLKQRYPEAGIDWLEALNRTAPLHQSDVYHHTFNIPVVWVVAYPDEEALPDLNEWQKQLGWLDKQEELNELLKTYNIPREHFQWTFLKVTHTLDDGTKVPAIRAIGLCTVLTVLRPVTFGEET